MDRVTHRTASTQPQEVLPASQYLHDRLQERRAKNTRPKRTRQSDFGPRTTSGRDDDIFLADDVDDRAATARLYDSSPLHPASKDLSPEADDGNATSRRRALGARQLDEQLDRLTKQNFDLKLEIDHRRAHQAKLQAEMQDMRVVAERAEQVIEEHTELLRINSDLVEELEKRDKAMQEAVEIICDLEERVEDLEEDRQSVTRPSTAQADSGYAGTETHEQAPPSSPPQLHRVPKTPLVKPTTGPTAAKAASQDLNKVLNSELSPKPRREPLFLSQKKASTNALRSVYLGKGRELHTVQSFNSILSKHTSAIDDDAMPDDILNSPRFSALSESSFPSIYSPRKVLSPEKHAWEPLDSPSPPPMSTGPHTRQDSISRVSRWMEEHDPLDDTLSKSRNTALPLTNVRARSASPAETIRMSHNDHFQSLNDALSNVAGQGSSHVDTTATLKPRTIHSSSSKRGSRTPTSFGGPIFGEPILPPTPESASTRMLRASRSSIVDERSIMDTTPDRLRGFDALEPGVRTAPKQMRSSVELKTAYASNLEYRKTGLSNVYLAEDALSNSDDDDEDDAFDERSFTVNGVGTRYDDYPDGGSILLGTPSRFFKRPQPSTGVILFDGNPPSPEAVRKPRRRKSSSEAATSPRKPSLGRAETSPSFISSLKTMVVTGGRSPLTGAELTSPVSYHSTSSGNRTVLGQDEQRSRARSPDPNSTSRLALSRGGDRVPVSPPRPTLTQKTQQLFRRLSSSHGDREHNKDRLTSPSPTRPTLPTLTSTPSSAYLNTGFKDTRRAGSGHASETQKPTNSTEHSKRSASNPRPPMQPRTKTEPFDTRRMSASETDRERRNVFRRRGSVKVSSGLERPKMLAGVAEGSAEDMSQSGASTRRPWR